MRAKSNSNFVKKALTEAKNKNEKVMINADELVRSYIGQLDWRVNENSNIGYSYQGLNNYLASSVQANFWLNSIYPSEIGEAHADGSYHIHDLGSLCIYCCGWSLEDLLLKGFTGVPGKISCAPAKHFRTALGQVVNYIYTLQHEAAGAQAFSDFDTYLAPFIRYDKLEYPEVKQAMQEFIFNMNVPTRVGGQAPFSNITMDIIPSGELAEQHAIIGGKLMPEKYKDFQEEMKMINKAFTEVMQAGDAIGRVFTWPIPTYNITKDFNWDDPELNPIWEMTAKYGIPYFSNFINSDMDPNDARSMCCRLRLDNRVLRKRGGGLFGSNPLTGSVGVVTINMPRIGFIAKTKPAFYKRLDELMDLAKRSLIIKRAFLEEFTEKGLYPYSRFYLSGIKQRFGEYWKNHFNTIGLVGMNEAVINFLGKDIASKEGQEFALEIMDHMRDRLMSYQDETGDLFNLEATPAESTSFRFAKKDKDIYPGIIQASDLKQSHNGDAYYTNSTHLPVGYSDDIFETLDLQDELQTKYTGGTVIHVFLGEKMPSSESTKNLIRKIAENYKLPYFTITPTFSVCPNHGYLSGEHVNCPKCAKEDVSQECEVYSRIVGYLRPVNQWNKGKKSEWQDRKTYKQDYAKKVIKVKKSQK